MVTLTIGTGSDQKRINTECVHKNWSNTKAPKIAFVFSIIILFL